MDNTASPVVGTVSVTDALNDKVIILICNMTDTSRVFTAFNITEQLRIENPLMSVPHNDVKEMVLDLFRNDFCETYASECIDLKRGDNRFRAYVYHPKDMTPFDHKHAVSPAANVTAPTSTPAPLDTDLTKHNRLNIPKSDLEKLGLLPGKQVKVESSNGIMSLTEVTSSPYDTLTVNTDGRLRLNATMLTEAFGRLPAKYDIKVSDDDTTIFVKPEFVKP